MNFANFINRLVGYILKELNYNVATNCFMSRGLDNHQATKLRVCTLVMFFSWGKIDWLKQKYSAQFFENPLYVLYIYI